VLHTHSLAFALAAATTFRHTGLATALRHPGSGTTIHIHAMLATFHHHFLANIRRKCLGTVGHPANTACDKTKKDQKTNHDKKPGDKSKDFTRLIFSGFREQQRTREQRE